MANLAVWESITSLLDNVRVGRMEQHTLKNVNKCLDTNIYSYLETSSDQSPNHRYQKNIDSSSFVICLLLAPHFPMHFWLFGCAQ
jgi:hypothetical protein